MIEGHVLLLNGGTWEPLTVVSIPRAINLLLAGKAIVVEESGRFLRTVRDKFPVPSVIALRHFINVPRRHAHWSRQGVLVRDNYTCIYCGATLGMVVRGKTLTKRELTVDHILPVSRGGKKEYVVQYGVRVLRVQSPQRQPSAGRGRAADAVGTEDAAHQLSGDRDG